MALITLLTLVLTVPLTAAPVARLPIVDQAIAHHGGERYRASESELDICSKSGCFHVTARLEGDRYGLTAAGEVRNGERRVRITNESVERWENGTPVPVPAEDEQALRDWVMARVYFAFLPFRLDDDSVYKEDLGLERWGDRDLHKVKVTFKPGTSTDADDQYLYWFDPTSGQVEQFAYSYGGSNPGLRFRRAFNHRRIGGILFFDQENLGIEGEGLRVDQLDSAFVAKRLRQVSTVTLRNIEVRPLGAE